MTFTTNIKLEELVAGDTIYCSMVETSADTTTKRLISVTLSSPVIFDGKDALIQGTPTGMHVDLTKRDEFEKAWFTSEQDAINNPVEYKKG
jgi:hypothetical protein